jgi:heme-degrading monooxygenase HmoA
LGAQVLKNRSTDDVERFLSLIRFENREKIQELELDL